MRNMLLIILLALTSFTKAQNPPKLIINRVTIVKQRPEHLAKELGYLKMGDTIPVYGYQNDHYCVKFNGDMVYVLPKTVILIGTSAQLDSLKIEGPSILAAQEKKIDDKIMAQLKEERKHVDSMYKVYSKWYGEKMAREAMYNSNVTIGMPSSLVYAVKGLPEDKYKLTSSAGVFERWKYKSGKYVVHLLDDKVIKIVEP